MYVYEWNIFIDFKEGVIDTMIIEKFNLIK